MHENREISSTPWSDDQGRSAKATSRNADTHVPEKSDCFVVPVNQPNKGGQPSAEVGEGRAQTPVVIPGGGKGDQSVESPGVKVPVGWVKPGQLRQGGERIDRS